MPEDCGCTPEENSFINPITPCNLSLADGTDSSKIVFTGAPLDCLDILPGATLESILVKIDAIACNENTVDWSTFDYSCLADDFTLTTPKQFVEAISASYCDFKEAYDAYVITNNSNISTINTTISGIINPAFPSSCASVGITSADTLKQAVQKLINRLCAIDGLISISGVNWNSCFTVSPLPTTIAGGLNIIISWICDLKAQLDGLETPLPLFNNVGTCLPSPTSTDSLYDTVVGIRDILCEMPALDISDIIWPSCIAEPSGDYTISDVFNAILPPLNSAYTRRITGVGTGLTWTQTTFDDTCSGFTLGVDVGGFTDKLVAVNSGDTGGYLANKLVAGTNTALVDNGTTLTINSTYVDSHLVKVGGTGDTPGLLIDKTSTTVDPNGVLTLTPFVDQSGPISKFSFTPTFDFTALSGLILATISADSGLMTTFCNMVCICPDCDPSEPRPEVSLQINNLNAEGNTFIVKTVMSQNSPTVAFYSGTNTIASLSNVVTGTYNITSVTTPIYMTLSLTNKAGFLLNYAISVVDASNIVIPNSFSQSGTIADTVTLNLSSVSLGDYSPLAKIVVDYSD